MAKPAESCGYGVIEGFYGTPWSSSVRRDTAGFLAEHGYSFYLYAPKADAILRERWQQDWPSEIRSELEAVAEAYHAHGLLWGVGLSPFEVWRSTRGEARTALKRKVRSFEGLGIDILALLFDDMRGDLEGLATVQAELAELALETTKARRVILCPTYYSYDPLLDSVFGARPEGYLEELGRLLPPEVDVFWTGPGVWSPRYSSEHLEEVTGLLGRKPFLWDNYPVNDVIKSCFLNLRAFEHRQTELAELAAGHAVNPMTQPFLSRIPLATLRDCYAEGSSYSAERAFTRAATRLCGEELARELARDLSLFQDRGRDRIEPGHRRELSEKYRSLGTPYGREVVTWLAGASEAT